MVCAGGFTVAAAEFVGEVFAGLGVDVPDETFFVAGGTGEFAGEWVEGEFVGHGLAPSVLRTSPPDPYGLPSVEGERKPLRPAATSPEPGEEVVVLFDCSVIVGGFVFYF